MKKIGLLLILLGFMLSSMVVYANDPEWLVDFEKARRIADEKDLPILVNFTGSDWCPWCKRLVNEVFSKEAFKSYASEKLVLFMADFPKFKTLPDDLVRQNRSLATQYGIKGFPTILLLNAQGKVLAQDGYRAGGAVAYVERLNDLLDNVQNQKDKHKK